ncbi:MAG: glycoside hydrolase family 76 protein [Bacteroidales bacterium]
MKFRTCILLFSSLTVISCSSPAKKTVQAENRGATTLDSLYKYFGVANTPLLREIYPFDEEHKVTYLADQEQIQLPHQYSYLWPYSGTFSAVNALYESTKDSFYLGLLEKKVLPGLNEYFDQKRNPGAYASYIVSAPESDRFYDDNIWIGIDYTDLFEMTHNPEYLHKAKQIWDFIESGTDDQLGGGIYWCEQKKASKNTCSNAPGSVFALKLFLATNDSSFFYKGKELYDWTVKNLRDTTDFLYFDNIRLDGKVDPTKYAYNSGQMIQAGALLHKITKEERYLEEARQTANGASEYFFYPKNEYDGINFRLLKEGDIWFTAVMMRGFIELNAIDHNPEYLSDFSHSLDYAWKYIREENGLYNGRFNPEKKGEKKNLLAQAAMIEMFGRLASVQTNK